MLVSSILPSRLVYTVNNNKINFTSIKINEIKTTSKFIEKPNFNSNSLQNSNIKSFDDINPYNNNNNNKKKIKFDLTLPFTNFELFLFLCPCFGNKKMKLKKKLFKTGQTRFYIQLDILTYLEKIQQIEVIHKILFNNKEKKMIKFLSKPAISLDNKNNNDLKKIAYKQYHPYSSQNQIDEIFKYYQYLDKKICKNENEEKLYILAKLHIEKMLKM